MNKNKHQQPFEKQYLELLTHLLTFGQYRNKERTGTGTASIFGHSLRHNLNLGFPLLTTKRVFWRGVVEELAWFLRGESNIDTLKDKGVNIWNKDAQRHGSNDLGPIYGPQWRQWQRYNPYKDRKLEKIDQISDLLKSLKENPQSRRHLLSAWNVADLDKMALPPCHPFAQFYVNSPVGFSPSLSCMFYMRSCDVFLGLPFNIASYALLTHLMAHVLGYGVGELIVVLGDAHLYLNHTEQAKKQIQRKPKPMPRLKVSNIDSQLRELTPKSIELIGYNPHPKIKAPLS